MNFYRDTFAQIDLTLFEQNFEYLKKQTNKQIIAVIKANGYGHGAAYIAKKALECGACMLAVSSLDEALTLRYEKIEAPILIIGYTRPRDVSLAMNYNITITVPSIEWIKALSLTNNVEQLKVHLKVDTAMNRLGMKYVEELKEAISLLKEQQVAIDGIYTHYACSDIEDEVFTKKQFQQFKAIVSALDFDFKYIHASNSDASVHFEEHFTNAARVGLAMYGISSFDTPLKPILSLYTQLVNVKEVEIGEGVGYSQTYHSAKKEWIATIPIGYADGWLRKNQGHHVYIENQACEIVGRICMDQCMIRLHKYYPIDTSVEIIGKHTSVKDIANYLDTIPYEIVCLISDRVPRVYLEKGEIVAVDNHRMRYNLPK